MKAIASIVEYSVTLNGSKMVMHSTGPQHVVEPHVDHACMQRLLSWVQATALSDAWNAS